MKKTTCPTCDGNGEAVFSCCTGEVIHSDLHWCPTCGEHLGEETCEDCNGTGEIEVGAPTSSVAPDLQLQAEHMMDVARGQ